MKIAHKTKSENKTGKIYLKHFSGSFLTALEIFKWYVKILISATLVHRSPKEEEKSLIKCTAFVYFSSNKIYLYLIRYSAAVATFLLRSAVSSIQDKSCFLLPFLLNDMMKAHDQNATTFWIFFPHIEDLKQFSTTSTPTEYDEPLYIEADGLSQSVDWEGEKVVGILKQNDRTWENRPRTINK